MKRFTVTAAMIITVLALAACSSKKTEEVPAENSQVSEQPVMELKETGSTQAEEQPVAESLGASSSGLGR